ncbi:hypothetical protein JXA40_10385 [bacterium]|nr:hypothetical protein [candidate division CSSED10-310 bacterium]
MSSAESFCGMCCRAKLSNLRVIDDLYLQHSKIKPYTVINDRNGKIVHESAGIRPDDYIQVEKIILEQFEDKPF